MDVFFVLSEYIYSLSQNSNRVEKFPIRSVVSDYFSSSSHSFNKIKTLVDLFFSPQFEIFWIPVVQLSAHLFGDPPWCLLVLRLLSVESFESLSICVTYEFRSLGRNLTHKTLSSVQHIFCISLFFYFISVMPATIISVFISDLLITLFVIDLSARVLSAYVIFALDDFCFHFFYWNFFACCVYSKVFKWQSFFSLFCCWWIVGIQWFPRYHNWMRFWNQFFHIIIWR